MAKFQGKLAMGLLWLLSIAFLVESINYYRSPFGFTLIAISSTIFLLFGISFVATILSGKEESKDFNLGEIRDAEKSEEIKTRITSMLKPKTVEDLKKDLYMATLNEDYDKAAKLRDRISKLTSKKKSND